MLIPEILSYIYSKTDSDQKSLSVSFIPKVSHYNEKYIEFEEYKAAPCKTTINLVHIPACDDSFTEKLRDNEYLKCKAYSNKNVCVNMIYVKGIVTGNLVDIVGNSDYVVCSLDLVYVSGEMILKILETCLTAQKSGSKLIITDYDKMIYKYFPQMTPPMALHSQFNVSQNYNEVELVSQNLCILERS